MFVSEVDVVVDGVIYQLQTHGGISRLYNEILPRMCDMDASLHVTLLTAGQLKQSLPTHSRISYCVVPEIERYLRPQRLWGPTIPWARQIVHRLWFGQTKGRIWHSTYYTLPEKWDGRSVVTVVDTVHERFLDLFNRPTDDLFREQKRRCILASDAVICISENTRKDVQHIYGLDSDRIRVISLAHSEVFRRLENGDRPSIPLSAAVPFILYVGSRGPNKNFDSLLKAYSVWHRQKEVALIVVSEQWSIDEKKRLAELGIWDQVHLLMQIDDESLCHLYNQASAFVYPSHYEGFGIPLLEAMACGCPVIASWIPSTIEVAGDCPIYFDPAEVDDLIVALNRVLIEGRDSARCRAGLLRVKDFSWNKTASQTLDVYRALIDRSY